MPPGGSTASQSEGARLGQGGLPVRDRERVLRVLERIFMFAPDAVHHCMQYIQYIQYIPGLAGEPRTRLTRGPSHSRAQAIARELLRPFSRTFNRATGSPGMSPRSDSSALPAGAPRGLRQ